MFLCLTTIFCVNDSWDAIVIGAGHNGLVAAAYLARSGFRTAVLESRSSIGGCASTVDALGVRVNICNCDHSMIFGSEIIHELSLESHGLKYQMVDPAKHFRLYKNSKVSPLSKDDAWWLFRDPNVTIEGLNRVGYNSNNVGVSQYRSYLEEMLPVARHFVELSNLSPSFIGNLRQSARHLRLSTSLLKLSRMSLVSAMSTWFDQELFLAPSAATVAVWGRSPYELGTGLGALGYALSHVLPTARPVGGSGALCDSILESFKSAGGSLFLNSKASSISIKNSRIDGVFISDGRFLSAKNIISTIDPRSILVSEYCNKWTKARRYSGSIKVEKKRFGYESKLDAVVDYLPSFCESTSDEATKEMLNGATTTLITPNTLGVHQAFKEASMGRVARQPILMANAPDVMDESLTPVDGGHIFSLEVLFTPYDLVGGWPNSKEPLRWLEVFSGETSNDFISGVKRWRCVLPLDYEADFGLELGYAPSFAGSPLSVLFGRSRDISRYETPIPGLFTSGARTFPGAGIWGASGRNVAHKVIRTLSTKSS